MASIDLKVPWTYRTALVTTTYPAGSHEVPEAIALQALAEGVSDTITEEHDDGDAKQSGKTGRKGASDKGEG